VSLSIGERIDPPKDDARHRLNQLADSKLDEEEASTGPICFGPRIRGEPFPAKFALPCDMPKYIRAVKPEDWLADYDIAVNIAGGNKRTAVRYTSLMLIGSAQTWLNSLPALQINSWHDFKEAFIKTFTGTYKRPSHPRQLALCKQGCSTSSQRRLEASSSQHPVTADITTVIATARGKMSVMITSMAPSRWLLSKEARGLRVEARSAKETSSARISTPSR
jgi:hypothetical protein